MSDTMVEYARRRSLVTGANGFVGHAVCAELARRQWDVRRVVRGSSSSGQRNSAFMELNDIGPATDWSDALDDVDVIVHLAARVHVMQDSVADPLAAFRSVNVGGALNLARQAAAAGVKRFVFVSSVKINGEYTQPGKPFSEADAPNPQDPYGQSKWEAEQGLLQLSADSDMDVVIIRPPLVYGPGVKANFSALMRAVQRGWPLPFGGIRNLRSLVALDNLVDFILISLSHAQAANQTFFVSDGHDLSTPGLVHGLARAAGVSARLVPMPVWTLRAGAVLLGKGPAVQRLCGNLQVDISKARSLLAWEPPVSVDEGLRRAVAGIKKP